MPDPITVSSLGIITIMALLKAIKRISSRLESSSCTTKDVKIEIKATEPNHLSDSTDEEKESSSTDSPPPKRGRSKSR